MSDAGTGVQHTPSDPALETFTYDDAIVRKFALATLIWGIVAFLAGVIIAALMAAPDIVPRLKDLTGGRVPIIGVGGIARPEDARAFLEAGATLLENMASGPLSDNDAFLAQYEQVLPSLQRDDMFARSLADRV